jgi:site-specific DNA-methyltransferase (adenine-specific)
MMIYTGNNLDILPNLEQDYYDSCITDPPYGQNIEGWDKDVPPVETWLAVKRVLKPGAFLLAFSSPELYHRAASRIEDAGFVIKDQIMWMITTKMAKTNRLKPAHEPIVVAQKAISESSLIKNQERWGTGLINIDSGRVPWEKEPPKGWTAGGQKRRTFGKDGNTCGTKKEYGVKDSNPLGRYPSNIVGLFDNPEHQKYFYAPRVNSHDRGEGNDHPTPKPVDLMRWLIKIYTPEGGNVLDPFAGSGSTGVAALESGYKFTGIELSEHYVQIANNRISQINSDLLY